MQGLILEGAGHSLWQLHQVDAPRRQVYLQTTTGNRRVLIGSKWVESAVDGAWPSDGAGSGQSGSARWAATGSIASPLGGQADAFSSRT